MDYLFEVQRMRVICDQTNTGSNDSGIQAVVIATVTNFMASSEDVTLIQFVNELFEVHGTISW